MNSEFIRRSFLDFFSHKGHEIVSSASLLPEAPNLLFTNAGMNPFVPYFLGQRTPPHRRLADTQKCIRAGGKHNDLEDVGFDTYHHTFFEMLGNWSFGDYFKEEAIQWAWELLTSVWSFPKERLYATVYRPGVGDPAEFDAEAYRIWTEIFTQEGLDPKIHVRTGGKKDNFWMMGNTGPCGPCTEIHMDLTPLGDTQGERVNGNHPACMEIWNLVFIQYDAQPNHAFEPLKEKFVDTGMGLERIAGIWAGTRGFTDFSRLPSNYDGDLFQPLFEILAATSGHPYGGRVPVGKIHLDEETLKDCAFRVLADHLRTLCFAIGDGIFPGHEGRHYVLRRILRRALLFGTKLSLPEHFFSSQSGVFVEKMGPFFKELVPQAGLIREVLKREEEIFTATLKRGIHLFEKWTSEGTHEISGEKAFLLYDTYGFPLDLTQLMASERGQTVNVKAFERCMETQRRRTKSAQKKETVQRHSDGPATHFVGYDEAQLTNYATTVEAIVREGNQTFLVVPSTPFYAEKGGQIGDAGHLSFGENQSRRVLHTTFAGSIILHLLDPTSDSLPREGEPVRLCVDLPRRRRIQRHHTGTHLLHWAMRQILGTHVRQAGSLVTDTSFRFDFSHFEKISEAQLWEIERLCAEKILENKTVSVTESRFEDRPPDGLAFFGDQYGDTVRVVRIDGCGAELCGGTHLQTTGQLGWIKILQESSVAAGTRRIEAIVGESAYQKAHQLWSSARKLEILFSRPLDQIPDQCKELLRQKNRYESRAKMTSIPSFSIFRDGIVEGLRWKAVGTKEKSPDTVRSLGKQKFTQEKLDILLIQTMGTDREGLFVFCSPLAIGKGYSAHRLVQKCLASLGGRGGGKPDFATGGLRTTVPSKFRWEEIIQHGRAE